MINIKARLSILCSGHLELMPSPDGRTRCSTVERRKFYSIFKHTVQSKYSPFFCLSFGPSVKFRNSLFNRRLGQYVHPGRQSRRRSRSIGQSKKSAGENGKRETMNYHLLTRKMDSRTMTFAIVS